MEQNSLLITDSIF